ncbi:MAG TPA: MFS transporter, partial [Candidatus Methanoperedens sp.]
MNWSELCLKNSFFGINTTTLADIHIIIYLLFRLRFMKISDGNSLILKLMLINISTGIAMGMMNLILPIYALSLDATSTEIGLIKGISGVGDLLVVLPAGFLVDYLGSKRMYSVSAVMGALTIISISFATSIEFLLLIMVFFGMARTLRTTSLSADFFKHMNAIGTKRGGWFKGSMTMGGGFIGPMVGGIAAVAVGFTGYFALASAFLLAPFMVIIARANTGNNPQIKPRNSSFQDASNHYRALIKNRTLTSATIIESLNSAFFITFATFITVLVIRDLGLSPGVAAIMISLKGAATILVVFFFGHLVLRNNNNLYLFSFAITILGLLVLGLSRDTLLLAVASIILGVGSGMITLTTFTQVGNIDGEKGKIAGIFSMGLGMGSIIGPTLGGVIGDYFGVQAIFLAFMVPFGALIIYTFLNGKRIIQTESGARNTVPNIQEDF